jgi:hypothetical protein
MANMYLHVMKSIALFFLICLANFNQTIYAQSVEKILKSYYKALGGEENIRKLTSSVLSAHVYTTQDLLFPLVDRQSGSTTEQTKSLSPYFCQTNEFSFWGEHLYVSNEQGRYSIVKGKSTPSTKSKPTKNCSVHSALHLKLLYENGKLSVGRDTTISNQKCHAIRSDDTDNPELFYFRKSDGLLYAVASPNAAHFSIFTDYREVQGILYPFNHDFTFGTTRWLTQVDHIEFNVALKPEDFAVDESKLVGLRDSKFLRSHIEFLKGDAQDLNFPELISKHFPGNRVLIYPWATSCEPCKFEFLHYDGFFYTFLSDLQITLVFVSVDEVSNDTQWKNDVHQFNLNGYHVLAPPTSRLYNDVKDLFHKGSQLDSPRYILIDEKGAVLSQKIKTSSDAEFKSQLQNLLKGN